MIYVVAGDRLVVSNRLVAGEEITHAALAEGDPVQAAGELEVVQIGDEIAVMFVNNKSGHYRPDPASLAVAQEAFKVRGLRLLPDSVHVYDRNRR